MKTYIVLTFGIVILILGSCDNKQGAVPAAIAECVDDTVIHVHDVTIGDNTFTQMNITILVGDTVKWTYPSTWTSSHTTTCNATTSGTFFPSGGTQWNSGNMNPGDSFKTKINVAGNYTYVCAYHTGMMGTILVKPRCN